MAAAVAGLAAASLMFNGSEAEDAAFSEAFTEPLHLNFSASEQVWLKEHTRLKVGVIRDMPPYEEYNAALRRPEGIAAGYWEVIAESLNMDLKPVPVSNLGRGSGIAAAEKNCRPELYFRRKGQKPASDGERILYRVVIGDFYQ